MSFLRPARHCTQGVAGGKKESSSEGSNAGFPLEPALVKTGAGMTKSERHTIPDPLLCSGNFAVGILPYRDTLVAKE